MRYAAKVKADPSASLVYAVKAENEAQFRRTAGDEEAAAVGMSGAQKVVLALFFLAFVVMIYGVIPWEDLGIRAADAVVVVPGDDRVVPAVRDPDRGRRPDVARARSRRRSSTARGTCSASR